VPGNSNSVFATTQVAQLMEEFDKGPLRDFTPYRFDRAKSGGVPRRSLEMLDSNLLPAFA
jgi:hypothetical protein